MTRAAIALGANLGDRLGYMRRAVTSLRRFGTITAISSLYETEPVGGPDQGRYLNAVVVLDTELAARDLLRRLHAVELDEGRERRVRWEARTLDLDLISYGLEQIAEPGLEVPHPRAVSRRFVVEPLAEVWPSALVGPEITAREALGVLSRRGIFRWEGLWVDSQPRIGGRGMAMVMAQLGLIVVLLITTAQAFRPPVTTLGATLGAGLSLFAAWMVIGATLALGRDLSAVPDPRPGAGLVESGPYRMVRHPIYGGLLLGGASLTLWAGSWLPLLPLAGLAGVLVVKTSWEERALALNMAGYDRYRERVRRRFIPFLW